MNTTAETLIAAVDATLLDEEKAKPILEGLLDLDLDVIQTPKEILDSFEKVAVAHDGNLEPNKIEESLRLLDDLAGKCDLTDSDVVEVNRGSVRMLALLVLLQVPSSSLLSSQLSLHYNALRRADLN